MTYSRVQALATTTIGDIDFISHHVPCGIHSLRAVTLMLLCNLTLGLASFICASIFQKDKSIVPLVEPNSPDANFAFNFSLDVSLFTLLKGFREMNEDASSYSTVPPFEWFRYNFILLLAGQGVH